MPPPPAAPFVLALLALDGVGRVTAHRVLERFPSLDVLRQTPHEQVLLRLKGAPNAERIVERLFDDAFDDALATKKSETAALAATGVRTLAPGDAEWPGGLERLGRAERPVVLYAYGNLAALAAPLLAVLGRPPVPGVPFEAAQRLARHAAESGAGVACGLAHGFDVAVAKVAGAAGRAPVAVLGCGLGQLAPSLRPAATALVRQGGLLLSPFPMPHGPFAHDDRERALVQVAVSRAAVVAAPHDGSHEAKAAAWAHDAGIEVAVVGADADWATLRADGPGADTTVMGWLADAP